MNKLLTILFFLMSCTCFGQLITNKGVIVDSATMLGSYLLDFSAVNDTTIRFNRGNGGTKDLVISGVGGGSVGWTTAGNTVAGTNILGSLNNFSVRMYANGLPYAVLDSNGRFGVGVTQPSAKFQLTSSGHGITNTLVTAALLQNATVATVSLNQSSPSLDLEGSSWNTVAVAGQSTRWRMVNVASTGGSAIGTLTFSHSANNGAFSSAATLTTAGILNVVGNINQASTTGNNSFTSNFILDNSSTRRYISFWGGGATIRAVIGHTNTIGDLDFRIGDATTMSDGTSALRIGQRTGNMYVNTSSTVNDALLRVTSTGKGVLFPSMTTTQRDSINLTVTSVTITNGGTGYTLSPTITFTNPGTGGITATSTGATVGGGAVLTIPVVIAGSYNATPAITITGGGGTGATATANITQVLTAGLIIYNSTTNKLQCWNGTTWNDLF